MSLKEKQEMLRRSVSTDIALERQKRNMSQSELAEKIGTQRSNISRIESGEQNLSLDMLAKIQYALGNKVSLQIREDAAEYFTNTEYSLRLFDEELLSFSLREAAGLKAEINHINEAEKHLLPPGLELSEEGLIAWLDRRIIPANREFVGEILSSMGLERSNLKGIIDISKGLSLNDSYWVVPKGSCLRFDDYNLFDNDFAEVLSLVAYTGRPFTSAKIGSSPEFTTNGVLRKGWRRIDGKLWLYKGGTEHFANSGNEPFSEYYAAQIAERMGLRAARYELDAWKGITASKCELFCTKEISFVPMSHIIKSGGIESCIGLCEKLGADFCEDLFSLLVFDYIIINEDRHLGNFGLLRDNKSGEYLSLAPIFDNGNSLLCYAMQSDFEDIDTYIAGRSLPYNMSYEKLLAGVVGPRQKAEARKLIAFRFEESDKYNLPSWRLRTLEEIIQKRIRTVLSCPDR